MPVSPRRRVHLTRVAAATSSVELFAASETARSRMIENDSETGYLDVLLGAGAASPTNRNFRLAPGDVWEAAVDADDAIYGGRIAGCWTAVDGAANCTEGR